MPSIPVDLRTVTRVRIGNQWTDVQPGTFTVGEPWFFIPGNSIDGEGAWTSGPGYHPLSYFFTDLDGHRYTGTYGHIQQLQHSTTEGPDD